MQPGVCCVSIVSIHCVSIFICANCTSKALINNNNNNNIRIHVFMQYTHNFIHQYTHNFIHLYIKNLGDILCLGRSFNLLRFSLG